MPANVTILIYEIKSIWSFYEHQIQNIASWNISWNLYEIGLWRSKSAKIDLSKQTSQILTFEYPRQTLNDIPGTKVTSKRRAIVFEECFGGPKNWTEDIGHSAITTNPTWQGRAYQTKNCIKCFWKCHTTKFNFNLDSDLLFECQIFTKKKAYKVRNVCHCGLI